jgi:hypothetical protein
MYRQLRNVEMSTWHHVKGYGAYCQLLVIRMWKRVTHNCESKIPVHLSEVTYMLSKSYSE